MDTGFVVAVLLAIAFASTNGLHDASNAIATLVATRAATPLQGIVMASFFNLLGPLLVGAAVADTIGGIVTVAPSAAAAVIGSGLAAAVAWNLLTWWFGLPSSSGHALVGGARLLSDEDDASEAADAAIKTERQLEHVYFRGMAALLGVEDRSERIARRELYRRCARIGETVVDVAERIVYAVVRQS